MGLLGSRLDPLRSLTAGGAAKVIRDHMQAGAPTMASVPTVELIRVHHAPVTTVAYDQEVAALRYDIA